MRRSLATGWSAFALGFATATLASILLCVAIVAAFGVAPGQNALDAMLVIRARLARSAPGVVGGSALRIAYLGDSTVASHPPGRTLPDRLQQLFDATPQGPRARVANLAFPGMGIASYYFITDEIVRVVPDLVTWQIAFEHLAPGWGYGRQRRGLAGFVAGDRLLEAALLPTFHHGLSADALLAYKVIVALGGFEAWLRLRDEQSRMAMLRGELERRLARFSGSRPEHRFERMTLLGVQIRTTEMREGRQRPSADHARDQLGSALQGLDADHPTLRLLAAALERYRARGIAVLVYLNPVNVEHLAELGLDSRDGLALSAARIGRVVEQSGARFVDLHALLKNDRFKDAAGHFQDGAGIDAPAEVVAALAGEVRRALATSRSGEPDLPLEGR